MKICVISTGIFQLSGTTGLKGYGGLEQIAWLCAAGLAAKGHEVTLIAPDGSDCPGGKVFSCGPPGNGDESASYNLYWKELLNQEVIIDHTWLKHTYLLKGEGRLKPPVLGVMHAPVDTMYKSLPPNVDKPCFVCISQDQADHFRALFGRPARVCYNGVDADFYQSMGYARTNRFLFLARFSTIKCPDHAIEIAKRCEVPLDLVGDTSITGEPKLYEDCKARADGTQIKILGGVSRAETVHWYSKARAMFHLNQRFREPFGLAPIEAQLCGLPVLAWDNGAMRETIKPGKTGFLVESLEEAERIVKSGDLDRLDRQECREWGKHFSIQRMTDRYEELCQEAIRTGGW